MSSSVRILEKLPALMRNCKHDSSLLRFASSTHKLVTMVYNCLHGKAPSYLTDCCTSISDVAAQRHLRSASPRRLLVPRHNLSTYGRRAFSVAGLATLNCLCDELREPLLTANSFRQLLKTRLFAEY